MTKHLTNALDKLKSMILDMAGRVEENVAAAMRAFVKRDTDLALQVIMTDTEIDQVEVEIEEECLHILALYQPVASDIRFVTSVLTINKDLERIGDLAVNLGEQALFWATESQEGDLPLDLQAQTQRVRSMLRRSLDAFVTVDANLAKQVLVDDEEVDAIHREMYRQVKELLSQGEAAKAGALIDLLNASRQLERIADHAVNISEDVIYLATGEIVRHHKLQRVGLTE